ncbi:hypothetical protein CONLIGDRAFT_668624 [Coniochaeta ligniaria NRRL 30616]|uniref:Uncharacterized protein n=1 Tax=Coniochaeta ligniaria NRRL 30616 TaxID=1408157 RepID=A0A1J7IT63_9PEZI|nr:hypothetical protein CONLIGDRAFT_668624 [Coniochaeta ligniaria NRRL 30616]
MAPPNSNHSGSPDQSTRLLPVMPTSELQTLYDELRRAEDELELSRRTTPHAAENSNDPDALLQPGTLPQATTMSRSPSSASHTSTKHGGTDGFGEGSRPDTRTKQRAKRRRPLDKVGKAKAALVRKLHACPGCKSRKVTCHHHDLSLFKKSYDARNAMHPGISLGGQPTGHQSTASPLSPSTHVQQQQTVTRPEATQRDMDLRGVSANPANTPFHVPLPINDAADQDILSQLQSGLSNSASMTGHPQPSSALGPYSILTPSRNPSLMLSSGALPVSFANGPTHESRYLPIGRQVSKVLDVWECQWAHNSDGTESLSSFNGEGNGCLQRWCGLFQLSEHYRAAHGAFHEEDPPFMWKCRFCQFLNDREQLCPQCPGPRSEWEKWYYGYVTLTDRLASVPVTSVRASDQTSAFGASLSSTFSSHEYSYSGFTGFATGSYSPGSGAGGSFLQQALTALPEGIGRRVTWIDQPGHIPSLALLGLCLYKRSSKLGRGPRDLGWDWLMVVELEESTRYDDIVNIGVPEDNSCHRPGFGTDQTVVGALGEESGPSYTSLLGFV